MSRPVCVITGTTSGIGRVTAEAMAANGYDVVMLCRDLARAETVRDGIARTTGNQNLSVVRCDLADLESVRTAADTVLACWDRLDVLINNAGTMTTRFQTSPDGLELTFAANYLGPWLLTRRMEDRLIDTGRARIVTVASAVHRRGTIALDVLGRESGRDFSGMRAYARSKLGNVMATLSQAERLTGTDVTANCLHPGVVATNIVGDTNALLRIGMKLVSPLFFDATRGAKTTLHLALSPSLTGRSGTYYDEHQRPATPAAAALDPAAREALWQWSSRFCGLPDDLPDPAA